MNVLTYLNSLRPALPLSKRKDDQGAYLALSNGGTHKMPKARRHFLKRRNGMGRL